MLASRIFVTRPVPISTSSSPRASHAKSQPEPASRHVATTSSQIPSESDPHRRHVLGAAVLLTCLGRSRQALGGGLQEAEIPKQPEATTSRSQEQPQEQDPKPNTPSSSCRQVYFDVRIGANPDDPIVGRIVVELFSRDSAASRRFLSLAQGSRGVDYRLSKFDTIVDGYVGNSGTRRMAGYSADEVSPISGGDSLQDLENLIRSPWVSLPVKVELAGQARSHDSAALVSLVILDSVERPIKERLIARDGKLITIKEQAGEAANGSSFVITRKACPELDTTNVVIGQVVSGMDVVERIGKLPVNKPRNNDVFFRAGKAIGDKRAVTAERAFNRPFVRVSVAASGVLPC